MRLLDKMNDAIADDPSLFIKLYEEHAELRKQRPWLYYAAVYGVHSLLDYLLTRGHDANEKGEGPFPQSALSAASSDGKVECVELLIRFGARPDVETFDDNPIFNAIYACSLDCVKLLVDAGIDIHKTYTLPDGRLRNSLEFAQRRGCTDIVEFLVALGATLPDAKA